MKAETDELAEDEAELVRESKYVADAKVKKAQAGSATSGFESQVAAEAADKAAAQANLEQQTKEHAQ